jgi:hypothetical protein
MAITGYREEKAWKGCMNRKTTLDITIILSGITGMVLSYAYLEDPMERQVSLIVLGTVSFFFFLLAVADRNRPEYIPDHGSGHGGISELLLLGEEDNITDIWDIYGKTSIVFGRDEGENQVDVDLRNTDYAGTVDREHAVMNFSGGSWYIEDLDSENGTRIRHEGEEKAYKISSREPCRIEKNDTVYLGLAPIRIR